MRGIKKLVLFLFLFGMANFSFAQNFDEWLKEEKITKPRKMKKAAKQADLFGKDYLALALYDQLVLLKPENPKYLVKAAEISQKLNDYEKANNYLSQLIFIDSSANNMLNWASLQIQIGDTVNVEKTLLKLTETKTTAQFTRNHKKLAENLLAGLKLQQKTDSLIPHPYEFKELKSINSTFSEQSPKLFNDLLYYISYKPNTQVILSENEFLADKQIIYVAKNMGYQWNIVDSVLPNLPDPKSQFIGSISPVTDSLWLTSVCAANYRGKTVCQLYWAKNYDGDVVEFKNGEKIVTKTLIWAAGITGNIIKGLPEDLWVRGGRLKVNGLNEAMPNIYALGDLAYMEEDKNFPKGHPQVAQVAMQQAINLAKNLVNNKSKPFKYNDLGSMATVGRNLAVVELPIKKFQGFLAWVFWMLVHLMQIVGVKNKVFIFINWFWNYITYDQSLRLILKPKTKENL